MILPYVYYIPIFYFERYVNKRCDIMQIIRLEKWRDINFQHFPLLMLFLCVLNYARQWAMHVF